jgi:hypothetical protein
MQSYNRKVVKWIIIFREGRSLKKRESSKRAHKRQFVGNGVKIGQTFVQGKKILPVISGHA